MNAALKTAVRSHYDAQKLRIEVGNRIAAQIRASYLGPSPRSTDPKSVKEEYKKRSKAFDKLVKKETGWKQGKRFLPYLIKYHTTHIDEVSDPMILSPEWAGKLARHLTMLETVEENMAKDVGLLVKDEDIWKYWLKDVKGVGPLMAGVLVSEIRDIGRFDTVSKLWAYSGYKVDNETGLAVRREKGVKSDWNNLLKTKLAGVLSGCFLKATSPYKAIYDGAKQRYTHREACLLEKEDHAKSENAKVTWLPNGCTKGHVEAMAKRYMMKMFLRDLYVMWRELEGLPIRPPYAEEFLGKRHTA